MKQFQTVLPFYVPSTSRYVWRNHHSENLVQGRQQGLTNAVLFCDQMALGVFPNCHEFQKIDFPVLKKTFGYLLVDRKPMGFWKFQGHQERAVALRRLRHVRYLDL